MKNKKLWRTLGEMALVWGSVNATAFILHDLGLLSAMGETIVLIVMSVMIGGVIVIGLILDVTIGPPRGKE